MARLSVAEAVVRLKAGGLVVFPTETVYGLAADATHARAIEQVFALKGRPRFNPLIVHFRDIDTLKQQVVWTPLAEKLAMQYWPGPLTMVLDASPQTHIDPACTGGLTTLAVRVPVHSLARSLLRHFPSGIAAPSANLSGRLSPTELTHVYKNFGDKTPDALDGGPCQKGMESTIIDARGERPRLLREGAIPREDYTDIDVHPCETVESPGQLIKHYAPVHPLRLNALHVEAGEALLAFGPPLPTNAPVEQLSITSNVNEAAARFFAALHRLDKQDISGIAVMPIPDEGLGRVINDRLKRGAS